MFAQRTNELTSAAGGNPYVRLLCVLGSAFLLLGVYDLLPWRMVFWGIPIAKANLFVVEGTEAPNAAAAEESSAPAADSLHEEVEPPQVPALAAAPKERVVDTASQRILLFGDSMVSVLVPRFSDYCLENGHRLFPAVWYGSTIEKWAFADDERKLDKLLVQIQPTLVVTVLGSSELRTRDVSAHKPFVELIVRKVGARKLLWIGPPNWRQDTGINELITQVMGRGRFFPSRELSLDRADDGIHPSSQGGARWVDAFVRWMTEESDFPIVFEVPQRAAPPVSLRSFPPP